jgi:hypothetical protein
MKETNTYLLRGREIFESIHSRKRDLLFGGFEFFLELVFTGFLVIEVDVNNFLRE